MSSSTEDQEPFATTNRKSDSSQADTEYSTGDPRSRYDSHMIIKRREVKRESKLVIAGLGTKRVSKTSESGFDDGQSIRTGSPTGSTLSGFFPARSKKSNEKIDKKWLEIMANSQNRHDVTAQKLLNKKFNIYQQRSNTPSVRKFNSERKIQRVNDPKSSFGSEVLSLPKRENSLLRSYSESDISQVPTINSSVPEASETDIRVTESEMSGTDSDKHTASLEMTGSSQEHQKGRTGSSHLSAGSVDIQITGHTIDGPSTQTIVQNDNGGNSDSVHTNGGQTSIRVNYEDCSKTRTVDPATGQIIINIVTPASRYGDSNVQFKDSPGAAPGAQNEASRIEETKTNDTSVISVPPRANQQAAGQFVSTNEGIPLIKPKKKKRGCRCCFCCTCRCGVSDDEDF
ncbi:uncharacterized protein LOC134856021 [Symsagittifera roscoffensis]|uniref:uncharacterized protein LOC134856021 n=1 Tax=Symsagittifera roscoffensis TaxID=84072 RepID=UPI00307BCF20